MKEDCVLKTQNLCILWLFYHSRVAIAGNPAYTLEYESPESCKRLREHGVQFYFNTTKLACMPCSQNSTFQTVSSDGSFQNSVFTFTYFCAF